jgi:hypothetical protein
MLAMLNAGTNIFMLESLCTSERKVQDESGETPFVISFAILHATNVNRK